MKNFPELKAKKYAAYYLIILCLFINGCATILNGETQYVTFTTDNEEPVKATISNDKFVHRADLPTSINVKRSEKDIKVKIDNECNSIEQEQADNSTNNSVTNNEYLVESKFSPKALLNLFFLPMGTFLSTTTDLATSSIWRYDDINVIPVENTCN